MSGTLAGTYSGGIVIPPELSDVKILGPNAGIDPNTGNRKCWFVFVSVLGVSKMPFPL